MDKNDKQMRKLDPRILSSLKKLQTSFQIFCSKRHPHRDKAEYVIPVLKESNEKIKICMECKKLLAYAAGKKIACPLEPEQSCRDCPQPCFKPEKYDRMATVMRDSGIAKFLERIKTWFG
ncbi:nitrous oxide-stimulated promoter family protein [Candidatus Riflebacteria bacterium]